MSDQRISLRLHVGGLLLAAAVTSHAVGGNVVFVDDDAPAGGDGTTWNTAYRFLQDALADAAGGGVTEVRVGQGTYKPDRDEANPDGTDDREATFQLINGVALMGGYAGLGAKDPDARDIELYETILSADLWDNDLPTYDIWHPSLAENSLHVLFAEKVDATAAIDGVVISGGRAHEGGGFPHDSGGGIVVISSTPTILNCTFAYNKASSNGGAILLWETPAEYSLRDCTFLNNSSGNGGAIFHFMGPPLSVINCLFEENRTTSGDGGAIYSNQATLNVAGCDFVGNMADPGNKGGGIYADFGSVTISDSSFVGNDGNGAGLYCRFVDVVDVSDCLFSDSLNVAVSVQNCGSVLVVDCQFARNDGGFGESGTSYPVFIGCEFIQHPNWAVDVSHGTVFIDCLFSGNSVETSGAGGRFGENTLIAGCTFENNIAKLSAGAMTITSGAIVDCVFDGNVSGLIGGAITSRDIQIFGCVFRKNESALGGAIAFLFSFGNALPSVTNSVFAGNTAESGGAIYIDNTTAQISNCTIVGNVASGSGGGIRVEESESVKIRNSIIWENIDDAGEGENSQVSSDNQSSTAIDYSCILGWTGALGGNGNIGLPPLFIDADGPDDIYGTEDDDVRLQSGSPCIDAGNNWGVPVDVNDYDEDGITNELFPVDLDGNPRFNADENDFDPGCGVPVVVDMGAYEYQFDPVEDVIFADLNGDGSVGVVDLLGLLGGWGPCAKGCCLADFDLDGTVGVNDLLILLGNWG